MGCTEVNRQAELFDMQEQQDVSPVYMQGRGVPGGHWVLRFADSKPFIPVMDTCASIPLLHTDVVVDIGAYVGTFTLIAARTPVRSVVAYEPTPRSFQLLKRNVGGLRHVVCLPCAVVADSCASVELHISRRLGLTNSVANPKATGRSITVPAIMYRNAVAGATVIKMDIEGGEFNIPLADLVPPTLRAIIIDFHPTDGVMRHKDGVARCKEMIKVIEDAGFLPVVEPQWEGSVLRHAGSWWRPTAQNRQYVYEPMMRGEECCGCGREINGTCKSICSECAKLWSKKHQAGYAVVPA